MKCFLFFISLLFSITVCCQTGIITGKIVSEAKPLEFAAVGLTGTTYASVSNSKGEFQLTQIPFGKYELLISLVGYQRVKKTITVDKETIVLSYDMVSMENSLNEVVVTGTMKEVSRSESPIPIEILTPKLFQKNPSPSLFKSIK